MIKKIKSGMQMLTKATASLNKKTIPAIKAKAVSVKPAMMAKSASVNRSFKNPALVTKAKLIKKAVKK
jgi:hypothetical protein